LYQKRYGIYKSIYDAIVYVFHDIDDKKETLPLTNLINSADEALFLFDDAVVIRISEVTGNIRKYIKLRNNISLNYITDTDKLAAKKEIIEIKAKLGTVFIALPDIFYNAMSFEQVKIDKLDRRRLNQVYKAALNSDALKLPEFPKIKPSSNMPQQ
jgi:hypothetical protein